MASENHVNLQFSEEKIRLTVLTNVCRMLVTRGYMDINKYRQTGTDEKDKKEKTGKISITVEQPSGKGRIDNTLFLPFIGTRVDNNVYVIPLDTPYRDEREAKGEGNIDFDGSTVVVKIIPQVVKDISNSPILNDFFKTFGNSHKIVIFDGMSDKVYTSLRKVKNVESFARDFFMMDIMSYVGAPNKVEFVTAEDMPHVINAKHAKIHENDPLSRYYNGKQGQKLRIVSPSINNCVFVGYRKIGAPKPGMFK
jgi:hypothetical protein